MSTPAQTPEAQDYEAAKQSNGYATATDAEKYRLAQAAKLIRLQKEQRTMSTTPTPDEAKLDASSTIRQRITDKINKLAPAKAPEQPVVNVATMLDALATMEYQLKYFIPLLSTDTKMQTRAWKLAIEVTKTQNLIRTLSPALLAQIGKAQK